MKMRFFLSALAAVLLAGLLYAVDTSADIVYGRQCPDVYYHNTGMYRNAETHYLYCYGCETAKYEEPHTENHAPTCTEGSSCAVCGIAMSGPIAHNFVQTQVLEATCYSPKTIISTCTGCKATEREKVGSPRAHQFGDYRLYTAATCDKDAVYRARCTYSGCGTSDIITRPSTALGHSFPEENYISDGNATCEQDGTKTARCVRYGSGGCQETHTKTDEGSALEHDFLEADYVPNGDATCEQDGTKTARCVRYGSGGCRETHTKTDEGSVLGHRFLEADYVPNGDATCEQDGTKTAKCIRFGSGGCQETHTKTDEDSALGHRFLEADYVPNGDATCEQDGTKTAKCIRFGSGGCRETHTVTIENSALGHDFLEADYVPNGDAACERDGTKTAKCVRYGFGSCRETHTVTIENSALGHDFLEADYVPNGDAACERDGTKTAKCVRYGSGGCRETHTKTDTGSALTHLPVNDQGYPPTCTNAGLTDGSHCGREGCDKIFTPQASIDPTGHSYTSVVTPPTCTEDGYTTHTCAVCRHRYTSDITARLSHYYGEWTPQESGTHLAPCRRSCGHRGTAACAALPYTLRTADTEDAYEFTLCPVCGQVSDGARLILIDQTTAQPLTRWLPAGEQVLRLGTLKNGKLLLTAAFEISGQLTQPTGQVQFTLPAKHLEGFTLTILNADGTEEPLNYTAAGKTATFTLDFTDQKAPAMTLHLTPEA